MKANLVIQTAESPTPALKEDVMPQLVNSFPVHELRANHCGH